MSALPPKADMCGATSYVRYGPKADIPSIHSVHLHDIVWLPSLVEELDTGTVEAQRHQKIPTVGCLDPVRLWRTGWLRRAEPQIDRTVAVGRDLVEAIDRWHQLRRFHHRAIGDVVGGDGPEQRRRWMGRQVQLVAVRAVQELALRIPVCNGIFGAGSQSPHDHGRRRRISDLK